MSISKSFLKTRAVCKVKFRLSAEEAQGATAVYLVGDFNNWDISANPMKKNKGAFALEIELAQGQDYQFRYRTNDDRWMNDPEADAYVHCAHSGEENSVVKV